MRTTLHMDAFGKEAIERYAHANSTSSGAVMRTAALYYLADRDSERVAWRVPRFVRDNGRRSVRSELPIDLDDDVWAAIRQEAASQGVAPETLAEHALLYFLADLDSGRVATRIADLVEDDGPAG